MSQSRKQKKNPKDTKPVPEPEASPEEEEEIITAETSPSVSAINNRIRNLNKRLKKANQILDQKRQGVALQENQQKTIDDVVFVRRCIDELNQLKETIIEAEYQASREIKDEGLPELITALLLPSLLGGEGQTEAISKLKEATSLSDEDIAALQQVRDKVLPTVRGKSLKNAINKSARFTGQLIAGSDEKSSVGSLTFHDLKEKLSTITATNVLGSQAQSSASAAAPPAADAGASAASTAQTAAAPTPAEAPTSAQDKKKGKGKKGKAAKEEPSKTPTPVQAAPVAEKPAEEKKEEPTTAASPPEEKAQDAKAPAKPKEDPNVYKPKKADPAPVDAAPAVSAPAAGSQPSASPEHAPAPAQKETGKKEKKGSNQELKPLAAAPGKNPFTYTPKH